MQFIGVIFWYLQIVAWVSAVVVLSFGGIIILLAPERWRPCVLSFLIGVALTLVWSMAHATTEIGGGTYSGGGNPEPECIRNEHHRCG